MANKFDEMMAKQVTPMISLGKLMKYGVSASTLVGAIAGAIFWFNSTFVLASDYSAYQNQTTGTIIEMRIDMLEARVQRLKDRYYRKNMPEVAKERIKDYEKKIARLEKQQGTLDDLMLKKEGK